MLRLINILILFIASAATAAASTGTAGDFDCRWMSHPTPDDTSHVWFSRTIVTSEKDMPRAAYIRVATTGRFVLYVNGRNVSTALFTPDRQKGDTAVAAIAYDVQRFLRPATNTIALLYCPSMRTHRQVSVCFYGIAADSSHFAVSGTDSPSFALTGNADVDIKSVYKEFSDFPNLFLLDKTEPPMDLWENTDADTLEGMYFQLLHRRMEEEPENARQILLAAEISRKLLSGREVTL